MTCEIIRLVFCDYKFIIIHYTALLLQDIGAGKGKYYAVNFPLRDGIDDESFESIFIPILTKVMESYQPSAIVLQCGADSLSGDRLGCFNLTLKGTKTYLNHNIFVCCSVHFLNLFDFWSQCISNPCIIILVICELWSYYPLWYDELSF